MAAISSPAPAKNCLAMKMSAARSLAGARHDRVPELLSDPGANAWRDLCVGRRRHLDDLRHLALRPFRAWRCHDAWRLWHLDRRVAHPLAALAAPALRYRACHRSNAGGRPSVLPALAKATDNL